MTKQALEVIFPAFLIILERQYVDQLPGGKYWLPSDLIRDSSENFPTTSLLNHVSCVPTCQLACVPVWFTCHGDKSLLTFHFYVPTCRTKGVPIFQTVLLKDAKGNFYT